MFDIQCWGMSRDRLWHDVVVALPAGTVHEIKGELDGPSRTIIVEPVEVPEPAEPVEAPAAPEDEPTPA